MKFTRTITPIPLLSPLTEGHWAIAMALCPSPMRPSVRKHDFIETSMKLLNDFKQISHECALTTNSKLFQTEKVGRRQFQF